MTDNRFLMNNFTTPFAFIAMNVRKAIANIGLLIAFFCLGLSSVNAQSFRTPTFSGNSTDFNAAERFGSVDNVDYYVTYDASFIYFGAFRTSSNTWGAFDHFTIYVDNVGSGAGSATGVNWDGNTPTLPFNADYRIAIRRNASGESFYSNWNGSSWTTGGTNGQGYSQFTTSSANGALEVRVPWSDFGSPDAIRFILYNSYNTGYFGYAPAGTSGGGPTGSTQWFGSIGTKSADCVPTNTTNLTLTAATLTNSVPAAAGTYARVIVNSGTVTNANSWTLAPGGIIEVSGSATFAVGAQTITMGNAATSNGRGTTINTTGSGALTTTASSIFDFGGEGNVTGNALSVSGSFRIRNKFTPLASGNLTFASGSNLDIRNGGFVSTNAPTYASGSTLMYNSGTNYGVSTEWTAGATSGAGYPSSVQISNNIASSGLNFGASNTAYSMGGTMNLASTTATLALSTGTGGLNIRGDWTRNASATFTTNSKTVTFNGTTAQTINSATTFFGLTIANTAATVTAAANITMATSGVLTINSSARLDIAATTLTVTGATSSLNGFLRSAGTITGASTTTLTFNSGGTYEHNFTTTSGTIPTSTWNAGSTCAIIGYTTNTTVPAGATQTFSNFTWNTPNQNTGSINFSGSVPTVNGTFTVAATGTTTARELRLSGATNYTLTGNTSTGIGGFVVSGGVLNLSNGGSTSTINVIGDFNQSGGQIIWGGSGSATINLVKSSGTQTMTQSAGSISNNISWNAGNGTSTNTVQLLSNINLGTGTGTLTVANNASIDFQTFVVSGSGTFAGATGSTLISANTSASGAINTSGANGSVQTTTRTFTNTGVNYTFNGASAQFTGTAIGAATNFRNLTYNTTGSLTLSAAATMSSTGTLAFGASATTLILGANDLTLTSGATVTGAGSTKYVRTSSTGRLLRTALTTAFTYPIGNSAYNPITVTNAGTSDTYGFVVIDGAVPNSVDATKAVQRYWAVTEGTGGGGNLTVVPQFNTGEGGASYSTGSGQIIGLYVPTTWTQNTGTLSGSGPYTVSASGFSNTLATSGTTNYFGIGNSGAFYIAAPPTITASGGVSASPNNGTATNAYVGSTVTITGTNFTTVSSVKVGGSGGTSVSFTVVNSTTITFTYPSSAPTGAVYVLNPDGNATSAESLAFVGYITNANNANHHQAATWLGGGVPPNGANITIANTNVQVFSTSFNPATVTVNSGASFVFNAGSITCTDIINNGTVNFLSASGTITTTTITNNSGSTLSWSAANTLNIAAGGTITHNTGATFTRGSGTVAFAGAGTIAGTAAVTLNNLSITTGGLTLTTVPTIDGTFTINGGNVNQSPIYSSNSTLNYNGTYGRYLEWGATGVGTIGSTAGYPNNVTISAGTFDMSANSGTYGAAALNGTLTINNGATFAFNAFANAFTAGALTIPTGGTLNMNTKTAATTITGNVSVTGTWNGTTSGGSAVSIGGNLTINSGGIVTRGSSNQMMTVTGNVTNASGGTLTLSTAVGGDLQLAGNWSNSGTFTHNSRQVTFNSTSAAQTLTGATTFAYLKINNTHSTPTVTLANAITVVNDLDLTAGQLVLGANNCTISSGGTISNFSATKYVNTSSTGRLIQTVGAATVFYPVGKSAYNPISLDNTGGTSDTYGVYVVDATTSPAANDNTKLVNRYWNVNEGTGGASNLTVTTQWNSPGEENVNFAAGITTRIGVYAGAGPWVTQNTGAITTGTVGGSSKATSGAAFTADISAGGSFGIGKDNGFLGVAPTLTSFTPTSQYRGGTIVLSGSGFTGTTSVTVGGTAASIVVDNDGQITATIQGGATGSVVVTNPSGSSTLAGFTFLGYITTSGATAWATSSSWLGGVVPPAGAVVTVANDLNIASAILNNPTTVTVNSGATMVVSSVSGSLSPSTSITIAGALTFGAAGSITTPLLTNNGTLSWSAAGTLNISAAGTLTNNGTFTRGTGTVNFAGIGTVNGSAAATFNNVTINTGALQLITGTAIDGTFRINGGNIDPAGDMPIYTANSTLFYNLTYGRFKEWDATGVGTIGTTPGYPNNVTVNTGTFTIANGSTTARAMNGLLTINNGATVSIDANISTLTIGNGMTINTGGTLNHQTNSGLVNITGAVSVAGSWLFNATSGATTVTGSVTNSGGSITMGTAAAALNVTGAFANTTGTFSMSSNIGGDLYVGGNLSNGGTFTHNSRAVFFNGTTQTVSGSFNTNGASNGFAFVRINNGTTVTLGAAATIINDLTFNSGKIALSTFNLTMVSGSTISTPTSSSYVQTNGTGQLRQIVAASNVTFPVGNSAYNPLTLNNTGTSDTYGVNVLDGVLPVANDATYTINRRWQVTELASGNSTLTATAQYNTGEENTNYSTGTVDYLGFYNGTAWNQIAATRSGSNPFSVVNNSAFNLTAADLTTGTQYFGIGRDNGLATAPPTVTSFSLSPNNGSTTSGYTGSTMTITGTNFVSVSGVTIGGVAATSVTTVNPTTVTCIVPQSGASGSVIVTTGSGTGTLAGFTYLGYITQASATDWATGSSWLGGSTPPAAATTTIAHNLNVATAIANSPATVTVQSGVSLTISNFAGAMTATTSITNSGTVTFGATGSLTTPTFVNNASGTLSWSVAGTLNISAAGTLTNNGTVTATTGTVNFAGAATVDGSNAITFNNLTINTGAVTLSTVPTINGTLRINGGNLSAAPIYTSNSTLQYAATYTRFVEWSAVGVGTIGTTPGYPNNVLVSNSATFTLLNADAGTARAMAGNLTTNTGATFTTGAINAIVTVGGNVSTTGTLSLSSSNARLAVTGSVTIGGTLTLSSASGGDLYVGGNLTNNGTFTHNSRAVFFTGITQSVSGTFSSTGGTTNGFAFVWINNGTNVTLGASAYVANDITFNSGKITLGTFDLTLASAATITSPTSSNYIVTNSTGQLKQVITTTAKIFPVGNSSYNPISLRNAGTSDTYGIRVVDAAPPAAATPAKAVNRYWAVTEAVAGNSDLTPVVLQYNTGEEGGSYNAGTNPYMGLYNGTAWTQVATTLAGANPFTATSTSTNQFPATIPSTSYFAVGKDDAFGSGLNDYYRSVTTGNWSATATWESSPDNTNWYTATAVPGAGSGTGFVTVRNGHTVTVDYVASPATLTIASGGILVGSDNTKQLYVGSTGTGAVSVSGTLTLNSALVTSYWLVCGTLTVGNGGIFNNSMGLATAASISTINVQNGGTYNHDAVGSGVNGSSTTDFAGGATTRTFGATSTCNITKWATSSSASPVALPVTAFGNLTINLSHALGGSWNQVGNITSIQGDFTVTNTGGATREFRLTGGTALTLNILGNVIVNGGYLSWVSGAVTPVINITKGLTISSGTYSANAGNGASVTFISGGTGDIDVSGGTSTFGNTSVALGRVCNILNTSTISVASSRTFTVNGYTNIAPDAVISGAGIFTLANTTTATLGVGSVDGITSAGTSAGNVRTTTRNFNPANYVYTGTANQVTGTGLPVSVNTLSISNTGSSGNNIVTLTRSGTTTLNSTSNPSLVLNSGLLSIGTGKNIDISSGGGIQNTGTGDFDATTVANSGTITFKGTGTVSGTINFYPGVIQAPSSTLGVTYGSTAVIRNFLRLDVNSFISSNPPAYATGSTLIYNSGSTYQRNAEWASAGAAVGTPHHVTVQGGTTLAFDFNNASTADRYMSGDLTLGVTGSTGSLNMGAMTKQIYVGGNLVLGGTTSTSTLTLSSAFGGDIHVKRNWTRNGFGTFTPNGRAVYLDSSNGTQTITATSGATYDFLIVDKAAGSVVLANDATINQTLTLSNGIISTGSNKLIANSTVARTNGWVAGNLQKPISATGLVTYETGGSDDYRPVDLNVTALGSAGALTVLVAQSAGNFSPLTGSGLDASYVLQRSYKLTSSGFAGTYSPTFNFIAGDVPSGANTATFRVRNYVSSYANPNVTTGTQNSTSTQATGVTTFGDFIIGNSTTLAMTTQPTGATVCQSGNTSFTAAANATPSLNASSSSNIWEVSTNGGGSWATVSNGGVYTNATTGTLNITGATNGMNGYQYRATFTDINGSVTSSVAILTVTPTVGTPVFSLGATSTRCQGAGLVSYTATATNNTGITYSLDATSLSAGNTINSGTGDVTYVSGYTGTSTITASAAGCNGPKTADHVVTITPTVGTPVFSLGSTSTRCGGTATITYTATATNNTGITYSLDATSLGAGVTINSGTGAVTYTSSYIGSTVITASAAGCNGPVTADHTVTVSANTWTGATSTAWNVGTNWSCGAAPLSGQDIAIPSVTRKPALVANTTVGALSVASGMFVTIGANTLTINGAVSGSGTLTGSLTSNVTMNGTGTLNFTSGAPSNIIQDFTINSTGTVTLGTALSVAGIFTPTAGTFALGNNNLTLKAGTQGNYANTKTYPATATVGTVGTATFDYSGGGRFVVERYIPAKRAFRFLAPSVTTTTSVRANWMEGTFNAGPTYTPNNNPNPGFGTHITGSATGGDNLDWTLTNNPSLFINNNATQLWEAVYNSNGTLTAGGAYRLLIRGSRAINLSNNTASPDATILRTTGQIVTGAFTFNTSSTPALNGTTNNFSLIGNPFASAVNWLSLSRTNVANAYTAWDPKVNVRGAYVSYNGVSGTNNNGASEVDQYLQPGQAVFVQTTGASPALTFNEASKVSIFTNVYRPVSAMPKLSIQLLLNSTAGLQNMADGIVAVFDDTFPAAISEEDATKFTNIDENLAIRHASGKLLSIEARPSVQTNDTLKLSTWQYRNSNYIMSINTTNFAPNTMAYLKDAFLNTELPLDMAGNTKVPITITTDAASAAADRFMIVFRPSGTLPVTVTEVKAFQKDRGIQVDWTVKTEQNIAKYEVEKSSNGIEFVKAGSIAATNNGALTQVYGWFDANPVSGNNFYRIKVVEKSGAVKYTNVVKVTIGKGEVSMSVYPNPVKGNTMNVRMTNASQGRYATVLYNNAGQQVYNGIIEHAGGSGIYSIKIKNRISKGSYRLQVSNDAEQYTETVIFE